MDIANGLRQELHPCLPVSNDDHCGQREAFQASKVSGYLGLLEVSHAFQTAIKFQRKRPSTHGKDRIGNDRVPPADLGQLPTGKEVRELPGKLGRKTEIVDTDEVFKLLRRLTHQQNLLTSVLLQDALALRPQSEERFHHAVLPKH